MRELELKVCRAFFNFVRMDPDIFREGLWSSTHGTGKLSILVADWQSSSTSRQLGSDIEV